MNCDGNNLVFDGNNTLGEELLDPGDTAALLLTICRALRSIHEAGLAHAALSPGNIRLAEEDGVEIETFPAPPPDATLMVTEPKYAAPELLLTLTAMDGAAHVRSDLYALGLIAYEALAGRDAFRRQLFEDGERETDLFWMKWHADTTRRLPPLSELNPSVPHELAATIQRMLEKDPAARLDSFDEVECAIERLQRRFETTGDIELDSFPGSNSQLVQAPRKESKAFLARVAADVPDFARRRGVVAAGEPQCRSDDCQRIALDGTEGGLVEGA